MKEMKIVTNQHTYPLVIGSKTIDQLPVYLHQVGISEKNKILVITDHHIAPLYLASVKEALQAFHVVTYIVQAGEHAKSFEQTEQILQYAIEQGLDRSSVIVALGGGVVGDLAGFVASIYMRGIAFVQCPTTILAHDSSVGGKVGINHPLGKNLIGSFYQPKLVFYDTSFLTTLPKREVRAGLAEVIKHGLIKDAAFVQWLDQHADALLDLQLDSINEALYQGIKVKAAIVKEDEKEQGIRAVLNYGHTLAHAIETISHYQFLHGEAVAIGMVYASRLAEKLGLFSNKGVIATQELINKFDLPTAIPKEFQAEELVKIMMRDKKFNQQRTRFILPVSIGEVTIKEGIEERIILETIEEMKASK